MLAVCFNPFSIELAAKICLSIPFAMTKVDKKMMKERKRFVQKICKILKIA